LNFLKLILDQARLSDFLNGGREGFRFAQSGLRLPLDFLAQVAPAGQGFPRGADAITAKKFAR
jgi:hypothetical protein